jgi:hypothetical protein
MGSANGKNAYARMKRAYISPAEMSADVETSSKRKKNVNEGEVSFYAVLEQKGHLQMAHAEMSGGEGISSEQYVELIEEISSEQYVELIEEISSEQYVELIEEISSEQYVELIEEVSSEWRVGMCVDQKTLRERRAAMCVDQRTSSKWKYVHHYILSTDMLTKELCAVHYLLDDAREHHKHPRWMISK